MFKLVACLLLGITASAHAQQVVDVVVVTGSRCPSGWSCYSFSAEGQTFSFATAAIYQQASLQEILAELKAEKRATLSDIARKAIDEFELTCNPGLSQQQYVAAQSAICVAKATAELSRSLPSLLLPAFGFSATSLQGRCNTAIATKLAGGDPPSCSTPASPQ